MGGRLALHYAISHPTSIKNLVLIGASPGIANTKERQKRFQQDQKLSEWILKNDTKTFIDFWTQTPLIRSQKNIPSSFLHVFLERKYRHSPIGLAATLETLSPGKIPSLWKEIKNISCPALIIAGEKDPNILRPEKKCPPFCKTLAISLFLKRDIVLTLRISPHSQKNFKFSSTHTD
jgi:2-succinyl-6-hydroxy-2,4-cyclohexadiene-1-carboxylate synthase